MVKKKIIISIMLMCFTLMFISGGCTGTGFFDERTRTNNTNRTDIEQEEEKPDIVIQGPDIPPDGMRYDEWKKFQYSTDTEFNLRTYYGVLMRNESLASENGIFQDPEHIEDARLTITDAKAEPVGGEMKLRSGGYTDITIEMRWTGTMRMVIDNPPTFGYRYSVMWMHNTPIPCDAYTGTALFNSVVEESAEGGYSTEGMEVGQAIDSGMIESDIAWNGRTYRLFAKEDRRNSPDLKDELTDESDNRKIRTLQAEIDITLMLRMPADYDGMVLAIRKDMTDDKPLAFKEPEGFILSSDTWADILTTDYGVKKTADDFYFVKVSDLLEKFDGAQEH